MATNRLSFSQTVFSSVIIVLAWYAECTLSSCMGCVELDEITFDKMIAHFKYTLVKFDIAFPYGPKHEAYGEFAKNYGSKIDDLLVSLVGVKDYGEKENRVLAERFAVDEKAYPEIVLFVKGDREKYVKFPKELEITVDNLKRFVMKNSKLYIPLEGCLEAFDKLSQDFAQKTPEEQNEVLVQATEQLNSLRGESKTRGEIYIRIMEKIIEKAIADQFVIDERKRVEKLLKEKISDNKKKQLTYRQNILQSFRTLDEISKKDEL